MQIITTHLNADFDGLASMIAAQKLYPEAVMVFSGSQERNLRKFLSQSNGLQHEFKRQKQVDFSQVDKIIIVDTRHTGRIGNLAVCLENPGIKIHLYDHHPDTPDDLKGIYEEVRPVGSTSTVFVQLFQEQKVSVTNEEATLLLMGIYEDTGSFTFSSTTPADMEAAAWLLGKGANFDAVSQFISHELTADQISLLHQLINSATEYTINGIDIVIAQISLPEYVDEFALLVRRFLDMENLNTLFSLAVMRDRIYFIARSRIPEVNVGEIAREFGGGGHASAASATIKDLTLVEAEEKLIQLLYKHVRPVNLAGELMSSPVITVEPDITIYNANQILTRYNITVLPVVAGAKDGQEILGMISRRVVEKSIFHGLGHLPVSDYMTTEVETLPTTATLSDIEELIIEHRQRLIPVVKGTSVCGVITRTDLLNLLLNDPSHLPKDLLNAGEMPSVERHRNLNNLMVEMLSKEMVVLLRTIGEIAEENSCTVFVVGGFVRDLMLHIKNFDLDIVVEGAGIDFSKKLASHLGGSVRTHGKFATAVVILPDGSKIDVATARLEYYEYPAAMPTVELSSIKLDLYRRDFTINAMAIHLNPRRFGILVDFFNSQNDIKERRIRILHNLSFVEDPTRIFRAIRFEQRMGFVIGSHTEKLIKNAVKMDLFDRICGRRCFNELKYILSEDNPLPALRRMSSFDLLKFIKVKLRFDRKLETILIEASNALSWHKLLSLDEKCLQWLVYLMVIFFRTKLDEASEFCRNFKLSSKYTKMFLKEKAAADRVVRIMNRGHKTKASHIYILLKDLNHEGLIYVISLAKSKETKKAVSHYVTHLRYITSHVQGDDLKALGYKSGPRYKVILGKLLEAKLDGIVVSRDDELKFLEKYYPLGKKSALNA